MLNNREKQLLPNPFYWGPINTLPYIGLVFNKKTYKFVIDSGSNSTVINSPSVSDDLKVKITTVITKTDLK